MGKQHIRNGMITALLLAVASTNAWGQNTTPDTDIVEPEMTFVLANECIGPKDCRKVVHATGYISRSSPDRLRDFVKKHGNAYPISFDSKGGSLGHGLHLGGLIRQQQLNTEVEQGKSCWSACAYAFLGGTRRIIGPNSSFGIHQFSPGEDVDISGSEATSFVQLLTSHLRKYVSSMGVDSTLVDWASTAPPNTMRFMKRETLISWNVDNSQPTHGAWGMEPFQGAWLLEVEQQQPGSDRSLSLKATPLSTTHPQMVMVGLRYDKVVASVPSAITICRSGPYLRMGDNPCQTAKFLMADNKNGRQVFLGMMTREQFFALQHSPTREGDSLWVRVHNGENTLASGLFSTKKFDEYLMLVSKM